MWSSLGVLSIILLQCASYDIQPRKIRFANGLEISHISRAALLKILSGFEEQLNGRIAWKKVNPMFEAQFANNQFTKNFIYPDLRKKVEKIDKKD